ncbi:type II secretion system minor pseudopilin GspJ [Novosphingobium sp. KCTC 2891]|uniref:type II secretion system minor pseudopilin GspJ n=1 Tax=Novosphingobium sp. KCTC 2891 TaxID=2989730 RepID=UPI00222398D6|nr:type II secretion system minor pseudopilin GspJ [Novosphingobium sp. KCTC 2891]MCW1382802.1 type II secretion system minor pseudopilin GspJ [Novosphingobium sp. KCTC 2891]
MTSARAPRANGFTLIEMLVALAVFALIAGGALMLLRFSVDAELASRAKTERIAAARRFLSVWTADLAQAAPRPARDENGAAHPALEAGQDGQGALVLRLVRSGWTNVDGAARPSLQKVEWRWDGKALLRAGYPFPDGAAPDPASAMLPLSAPPRLRFRTGDGVWHDRWAAQRAAELPAAIELLLPQPGGEPMRLVALVGVNYR